jgi:predicted metal-dependent phosphoesterase TrpH
MPRVDLHLHSTASDGRFPPAAVVRKAAGAGIAVIALTDHDTVDGVPEAIEAALAFPGMRLIPGVEISTDTPAGEVHILGYFINHTDAQLRTALEKMRNSRWERARRMVLRLGELGCPIDLERVREIAGEGAVGRPHVAQALMEMGHVASFREAFNRFIGRNGPAHVERDKLTPAEAVALVVRSGGLPVLAHPLTAEDPESILDDLKASGLVGLEAHYGGYSKEDTVRLAAIARRHDLVTTGGTDFHGLDSEAGTAIQGVSISTEAMDRLFVLAGQPALNLAGT